jgi:hypothetical protein
MLAELGSAAETALKLEASAPKIAVAIRPRRPMEGDEVFMVVSWIGDEKRLDLPDGGGRWEAVYVGPPAVLPVGFSSTVENAMRPNAAVHETGPKVGERG